MQADNYCLRIGNYYGTAGDSFSWSSSNQQKNAQFSTMDQDSDNNNGASCTVSWFGNGGWWFDTLQKKTQENMGS